MKKKKRQTTETTGPLRIVLFKGGQRPTSIQLTQKIMINLYTLIGSLIFIILFLGTILLSVCQDNRELKTQHNSARGEIKRLRNYIRGGNGQDKKPETDIIQADDQESINPQTAEDQKPVSVPAIQKPEPSDIDQTESKKLESPVDGEIKGAILNFKMSKDETGQIITVSYQISNRSANGLQFKGKSVVLVHLEDKILYDPPGIRLKDGKVINGNRGKASTLNNARNLKVDFTLPSPDSKIIKIEIILFTTVGVGLTKQEFQVEQQ